MFVACCRNGPPVVCARALEFSVGYGRHFISIDSYACRSVNVSQPAGRRHFALSPAVMSCRPAGFTGNPTQPTLHLLHLHRDGAVTSIGPP